MSAILASPTVILSVTALVLSLGLWGAAVMIDVRVRAGDALAAVGATPGRSAQGVGESFDYRLRRTRVGRRLQASLSGAGLSWTPTRFLATVLLAMVVITVIGLPLVGRISTAVFVIAVPLVASRYLQHRRDKRSDRFIAQLPEVARILANSSAAGLSVPRGIEIAATEIAEPAARELGTIVNQVKVGRSLSYALDDLSRRLPSRELNVLVRTLIIQSRAGGALVQALQDIARSLEERKQLRREAKTASSGSVFGGYLVIGLGVGSVVIANLMFPGVIDDLATSFFGRIALVVAFSLFVVGYVLMRLLTRVDL